jgi:hypothetical protein
MVCIWGMGDCGDDTVTKLEITNSIKAYVKNQNETINKIINDTMNSVVTDVVNNSSARTLIDNNSANSFFGGDIILSGDTIFTLDQKTDLAAEIYVINKLVSETASMAELQTSIVAKLQDKMENDAAIKAAIDSINKISEKTSAVNGPETMLRDLAQSLTAPLTAAADSSNDEKAFRNFLETSNEQINKSSTEIGTIVKNIVENNISTNSESFMDIKVSASNTIEIRNMVLKDRAVVRLNQSATLKNFTKATNELQIGTKITNQMLSSNSIEAVIEKFNKLEADLKLESENESKKEKSEKSALAAIVDSIMENLQKILIIIAICVVVIILAFGIPTVLKMFSKKPASISLKPPSLPPQV